MKTIKTRARRMKTAALFGIGALCLAALPALGDVPAGNGSYPEPGTLNYVQGSAYLNGSQVNNKSVGTAELMPDEVLRTGAGKAEVLLTPGVFLRVADHSAVQMISPDITNTRVALLRGEAGIEVDEIHPQNDLQIVDNGVSTQLLKKGFYEFTASAPRVLVFSGEAQVELGDGQSREVKKHHEMALEASGQARPHGFNASHAEDNLYSWSKLRSEYLAEENEQAAEQYGWAYPGWYWNPWALGWDWGPWGPWGGWGPWWGGGFWGGYYGGPIFYGRGYGGRGYGGHPVGGRGFSGGGGFGGGGFHGGSFHGGGGGRR